MHYEQYIFIHGQVDFIRRVLPLIRSASSGLRGVMRVDTDILFVSCARRATIRITRKHKHPEFMVKLVCWWTGFIPF